MNGRVGLDKFAERTNLVLLLAYPVLLLSVRGGMSTCFVLLLLVSLHYLVRFGWRNVIDWHHREIAFAAAMASLIGATLISQAYHSHFRLDSLDGPSRFLLAIPIYLMLQKIPLLFPRSLEYGFPLGVFTGFFTSVFSPSLYWQQGTYFADPAVFGGAILILGFLSIGTINWTRRDPLAVLVLKFAGFVVGIYCAIQTGERGVWIAIPILIILLAYYRLGPKYITGVAAITIVVGLASYLLIPKIHDRIAEMQTEVTNVLNGNFDTPAVGLRLQIWNATIEIFRQNPVAGVGPANVSDEFRALAQKGWLTPLGLNYALSQPHNEIFANMARLGIFGLLSIIAIYFIPMILFANAVASVDRVKHMAGVMGIVFVTGYFIFGLTIETFNIKMIATFYAVTTATLMAIAHHRGHDVPRLLRVNKLWP